jgi:hypothetical protein
MACGSARQANLPPRRRVDATGFRRPWAASTVRMLALKRYADHPRGRVQFGWDPAKLCMARQGRGFRFGDVSRIFGVPAIAVADHRQWHREAQGRDQRYINAASWHRPPPASGDHQCVEGDRSGPQGRAAGRGETAMLRTEIASRTPASISPALMPGPSRMCGGRFVRSCDRGSAIRSVDSILRALVRKRPSISYR